MIFLSEINSHREKLDTNVSLSPDIFSYVRRIEFLFFINQLSPLFDVETKTTGDESQEGSDLSLCLTAETSF